MTTAYSEYWISTYDLTDLNRTTSRIRYRSNMYGLPQVESRWSRVFCVAEFCRIVVYLTNSTINSVYLSLALLLHFRMNGSEFLLSRIYRNLYFTSCCLLVWNWILTLIIAFLTKQTHIKLCFSLIIKNVLH
jgi:hypothetical protein